jgi:SWIM zinc finger
MSSVTHTDPSRMTHNVAALFGHSDDTLVAWQQACVQAAAALQPPPDSERLAKALALAQDGAVTLEEDGAAQVTSGGTRYRVEADGTCHCPDVQHRGAPCKHLLAVQIHQHATVQLAPSTSAVPPRAATAQRAPTPDIHQGRLPSADRWDVNEAPASCCLRLRIGELELMYTMRDVSDAELTSRVQHLVPWVQDVLDQARERQAHLEALRQQRETAQAAPAAPALSVPQPTTSPADLQVLIQQAVQQVLAAHAPSTASANGQAPDTPPPVPPHHSVANGAPEPDDQQTGFCSLHQVQMEQKSNARGSWYSHWLRGEQQHCKGRRNGRR